MQTVLYNIWLFVLIVYAMTVTLTLVISIAYKKTIHFLHIVNVSVAWTSVFFMFWLL